MRKKSSQKRYSVRLVLVARRTRSLLVCHQVTIQEDDDKSNTMTTKEPLGLKQECQEQYKYEYETTKEKEGVLAGSWWK